MLWQKWDYSRQAQSSRFSCVFRRIDRRHTRPRTGEEGELNLPMDELSQLQRGKDISNWYSRRVAYIFETEIADHWLESIRHMC